MKRHLFKATLMTAAFTMALQTFAFAATLDASVTGNTLTATITDLSEGEESTILVVDKGVKLSEITENTDKIHYVDQKTVGKDLKAEYEVDVTGLGDIDVYSGYTSMTGNALFKAVTQQGGTDPNPPVGDYVLGDVTGDRAADGADAIKIINNWANEIAFEEPYKTAADVTKDGEIDGADAIKIINSWANDIPLE